MIDFGVFSEQEIKEYLENYQDILIKYKNKVGVFLPSDKDQVYKTLVSEGYLASYLSGSGVRYPVKIAEQNGVYQRKTSLFTFNKDILQEEFFNVFYALFFEGFTNNNYNFIISTIYSVMSNSFGMTGEFSKAKAILVDFYFRTLIGSVNKRINTINYMANKMLFTRAIQVNPYNMNLIVLEQFIQSQSLESFCMALGHIALYQKTFNDESLSGRWLEFESYIPLFNKGEFDEIIRIASEFYSSNSDEIYNNVYPYQFQHILFGDDGMPEFIPGDIRQEVKEKMNKIMDNFEQLLEQMEEMVEGANPQEIDGKNQEELKNFEEKMREEEDRIDEELRINREDGDYHASKKIFDGNSEAKTKVVYAHDLDEYGQLEPSSIYVYSLFMGQLKSQTLKSKVSSRKIGSRIDPKQFSKGKHYYSDNLFAGKKGYNFGGLPRVVIVVDNSGSTGRNIKINYSYLNKKTAGKKMNNVLSSEYYTAATISENLVRMKVPHKIICHTTSTREILIGEIFTFSPSGFDFVDTHARGHNAFEMYNAMAQFLSNFPDSGNADVDAFLYACNQFRRVEQPTDDIVIMVSDGKPTENFTFEGLNATEALIKGIEMQKRENNIKVFSFSSVSEVMEDNNKIYGEDNNFPVYQSADNDIRSAVERFIRMVDR